MYNNLQQTERSRSWQESSRVKFSKSAVRCPQVLTFIRLSMHFIIALLVGTLCFKIGQDAVYVLDNFNLLFFNIMFLMFSAFSATVTTCKNVISIPLALSYHKCENTFLLWQHHWPLLSFPVPSELPIITREYFNRWYKLHSFYLANKLADIPIQFTAISLYILIVYYMSDQLLELRRFCLYTLMCFAVSMVAQTFGLLVGTGMKIQVRANISYHQDYLQCIVNNPRPSSFSTEWSLGRSPFFRSWYSVDSSFNLDTPIRTYAGSSTCHFLSTASKASWSPFMGKKPSSTLSFNLIDLKRFSLDKCCLKLNAPIAQIFGRWRAILLMLSRKYRPWKFARIEGATAPAWKHADAIQCVQLRGTSFCW